MCLHTCIKTHAQYIIEAATKIYTTIVLGGELNEHPVLRSSENHANERTIGFPYGANEQISVE